VKERFSASRFPRDSSRFEKSRRTREAEYLFALTVFTVLLLSACASSRHETQYEPHVVVASWYGPEFQGRPTASGERFDMHALTCAHREYPFGSVLRVTNVAGGKSVKCVVNDRGPFVPGREIDLSYAAARAIGLTGTGNVRIEYLERDMRFVQQVRYASSDLRGPFTIQVGAFAEQDNARRLKEALDLKHKDVYITETVVNNNTFYRVRIGKFSSRTTASGLAKALAEEGYSPVVMRSEERI